MGLLWKQSLNIIRRHSLISLLSPAAGPQTQTFHYTYSICMYNACRHVSASCINSFFFFLQKFYVQLGCIWLPGLIFQTHPDKSTTSEQKKCFVNNYQNLYFICDGITGSWWCKSFTHAKKINSASWTGIEHLAENILVAWMFIKKKYYCFLRSTASTGMYNVHIH